MYQSKHKIQEAGFVTNLSKNTLTKIIQFYKNVMCELQNIIISEITVQLLKHCLHIYQIFEQHRMYTK